MTYQRLTFYRPTLTRQAPHPRFSDPRPPADVFPAVGYLQTDNTSAIFHLQARRARIERFGPKCVLSDRTLLLPTAEMVDRQKELLCEATRTTKIERSFGGRAALLDYLHQQGVVTHKPSRITWVRRRHLQVVYGTTSECRCKF